MVERSPALMSGIPELIVLSLLSSREMYGYDIARAIAMRTDEALSIGEGVLYPALHAMEARRLLRARRVRVAGRTRVYYGLTARGRARLTKLSKDWQQMSRGVDAILGQPDSWVRSDA